MQKERLAHKMKLTAVYLTADEGGFTCFIEEIPGAISQGKNIEEARENLMDALELVLEEMHESSENALAGTVARREYIQLAI